MVLTRGAAFAALVAMSRVASFQKPLERDTGQELYVGHIVLHGGTPYVDAALNKGPLTYVVFALIDAVSGTSVVMVRICLVLFAAAAALGVAAFVTAWAGRAAGIAAGAAFALLAAVEPLQGDDPNTEQYGVAFMAGAWGLATRPSRRAAAGAGAIAGAGFAMNPLFGLAAPFVGLEIWRSSREDRGRRLVAAGLGGALVVGLTVVWIAVQGALDDMAAQVFHDDLFGRSGGTGLMSHGSSIWNAFDVPGGTLMLLGVAGGLVALRQRALRPAALAVLGWIAAVWLKTELQAYSHPHHFYVAMPAVAAAVGLGLASIWPADTIGRILATALVLAAPFVTYVAGPQFRQLQVPGSERWAVDGQLSEDWGLSYPVAQYIRQNTRSGDRLLMVGSNPEVNWLADRRAPTRYFDYFLPLRNADARARRLRDLERDPPAAIGAMVNGDAQADLPTLQPFMDAHGYRLAFELNGSRVWLRPH
jgi:hypothetical protein